MTSKCDPVRLAELVPRYAAGDITWREVADATDASFGELLVELGRQGLQLPTCVATKRPAQQALFDEALARAADSRRDDQSQRQPTSDPDAEPDDDAAARIAPG